LSSSGNHDIARRYDRHLGPVLFAPYARELATRVARLTPRRVLEIAWCTGIATEALRHALQSDAELVATDLDADMLEVARRKLGDLNVRWEIADGATLPFGAGTFEVVVCQFGYMFFRDKVAGFREARRVLVDDGTLVFSVWASLDENPYGRVVQEVLAGFFGIAPSQLTNIPFGYHDEARIRADLAAADFVDVRVDVVDLTGEAASAAALATGSVRGSPVLHAIIERGKDALAIETELARRLASLGGDEPFTARLRAKVVTARR
jgi:ubiquinone/menaquinone biosynthesis C-methylase UbiE